MHRPAGRISELTYQLGRVIDGRWDLPSTTDVAPAWTTRPSSGTSTVPVCRIASGMSWVITINARSRPLRSSPSMFMTSSVVEASSDEVISSQMRTSGSAARARAIATR